MNEYGVAVFPSSSVAMRAEALAQRAGYAVRLIPTPRDVSSDCGVVLRFDWAKRSGIESLLREAKVDVLDVRPLRQSHRTGGLPSA
ncbi:MAG: DUF3343 domain-containing protein [Coriobacteriales bacterium]|nr:DUF3343 domain-containing protein [Actinomycetes bacterium]